MSSNELYDKVVGIDFDALAERTGFPVEDLRALDRECADDGIRTLMAHAEALAAQVERLQRALIREVNRNRQMRDYVPLTNDMITEVCRLQPGDLKGVKA